MTTTLSKYLSKATSMDASWEESKHHRADNGRFTSGSGRGKTKENYDGKGKGDKAKKSGSRQEMSEEQATKIVRDAFKEAKCELKGLKLVGHALNADVDQTSEDECSKINGYLTERGLKAQIENKNTFRIAEDGYDDMQVVDDPMLGILVELCAVGMMAKDLHYRANGRPFYGIHLLSDLVNDIEHTSDDLNEVYYMGEMGNVPPDRAFVASKAAEIVGRAGDMDEILNRLTGLVSDLANAVEIAKKPGVSSGTAAVLDDISKKALQAKGLLIRTQKDIEKSVANQAAIDKVVGRGIVIGGGETPAQDAGTHEGAVKAAQTRKNHGGFALLDQHKDEAIRAMAGNKLNPAVVQRHSPGWEEHVLDHHRNSLHKGLYGSGSLKEHVRRDLIRAYRKLGETHPASVAIKSSLNARGLGIYKRTGDMFKHHPWEIIPHEHAKKWSFFKEA